MKKMREAVSLIFEFKGYIFIIKRQNFLKTFPGYTAFIGGKVDPEDHDGPSYNLSLLDAHPLHLANALVRESKEELGIEIDRLIEAGLITAIDFVGQAVSPEFNPYRFNTYFFRISLIEKPAFILDRNEVMDSQWLTPKKILEQWYKGERLMVPPVRYFIEKLEDDFYFLAPLEFENRFDLEVEVPWIESIHGLLQLMPLSNTVPPAQRTNAFLYGGDRKILVDPSPKNENELKKLVKLLDQHIIEAILVTHHHKDHHQYATQIAKEKVIPLCMSQYTKERCLQVYGAHYFQNVEVKLLQENDRLGQWLGEDVIVITVPGHDEGQLAIMPKSRKWFLAGDLFQGIGTVVVGGEEGDMSKYFATLQKVIDLSPMCVIPSHGIALGGTYILEKTLEHRKFREKQVYEMYTEGLSSQEMLTRIYFNIPEKILKYAKANIDSHLLKLKKDGKI